MKLKKRLTKDFVLISAIFLVVVVVVSILFLQFNSSLNSLIKESEPTVDTIERMLLDLYQDNILLLDYLNIKNYDDAVMYDEEVEKSNLRCDNAEHEFLNLLELDLITDEGIVTECEEAIKIHNDLEELRDQIMILHKAELLSGDDLSFEKQKLLLQHRVLFKEGVIRFTSTLANINGRNEILRSTLLFRFKLYFFFLLFSIFFFLLVLMYKVRRIGDHIVTPIDEIINKTEEFVDGKYDVRLRPVTDILEVSALQNNINNIFAAFKKIIEDNPEDKGEIESHLLREEYVDIINFLKNNQQKKNTTITDLKKHLNVTHPTVLSRINFLEEKGYLLIKKDGREKFLTLTSKGNKL